MSDSLSEKPDKDTCACGRQLVGYSYQRPGPPGFWLVCPDDACDHSVAAMRRRLDDQTAMWRRSA